MRCARPTSRTFAPPQRRKSNGRLKIKEIVPLGPVELARTVKTGDEILAVDGQAVDAHTNIEARTAAAREVPVLPNDRATEKALLYRAWVARNRNYVERVSGGKLGYVHLFAMWAASLDRLYIDLDVQNQGREGVIVDIRNNNGGFIDPYVVDVFNRRDYITFTTRTTGAVHTPERSSLGQRALGRSTVLLVNEHSLSDAENFTEGTGARISVPSSGNRRRAGSSSRWSRN